MRTLDERPRERENLNGVCEYEVPFQKPNAIFHSIAISRRIEESSTTLEDSQTRKK